MAMSERTLLPSLAGSLAILILGLTIATTAHAAVTLLSEDRVVRATLDGVHFCAPEDHEYCICDPGSVYYPFCLAEPPPGPFSQLDEAFGSGFTDLDASVQVDAATASQTSSISASVIEGSGAVDASFIADYGIGEPVSTGTEASTTATSKLHVTFSVDEPTPYSLQASWDGLYPFFAQVTAHARLTDGVSPLAAIVCELNDPLFPPSGCATPGETHVGTLAPGTYHLEVEARAVGDPGELGGPPEIFGTFDYAFRLGLGPASAVPALGWIGRGLISGAILLATGALARRRSGSRAGSR